MLEICGTGAKRNADGNSRQIEEVMVPLRKNLFRRRDKMRVSRFPPINELLPFPIIYIISIPSIFYNFADETIILISNIIQTTAALCSLRFHHFL